MGSSRKAGKSDQNGQHIERVRLIRRTGLDPISRHAREPDLPLEQRPHILRGSRSAEQKSLQFGAAERPHDLQLLLGLNAFRRSRHVEAKGQIHDRLHDRQSAALAGEVLDKRAIDLDLVERKASQIAERGITGPEIINAILQFTQLMKAAIVLSRFGSSTAW